MTKYEFPSFTGLAILGNDRQYPTNAECLALGIHLGCAIEHPFDNIHIEYCHCSVQYSGRSIKTDIACLLLV
ncbi:MAG: hypothetical protein KAV87_66545, partial [Desulfobacteraceae bacterium]|nr:hypothetical protein [Desulfobacteraceae bacterium]